MFNIKKMISVLLALVLTIAVVPSFAEGPIEVVIPHYKTGQNVGAKFFMPQVDRFNAKYEGKYKIVIEELTQELYAEKMKQLGMQKKLPALVEGGDKDWIEKVVIPQNMYTDLMPFVNERPDLKSLLLQKQMEYNTFDGKLFSINVPVVRPIGLYYNSELVNFSKPTGEFANWDELVSELGDNKIAFMTGENCWTTELVFASLIANEEGGLELMDAHKQDRLLDYNNPQFINAAKKLQKLLQNNAAANTVGAVYADAANAFMSKNAALIANGSWMMGDFAEGNVDKWSNGFTGKTVKGGIMPGNIAVGNTDGYSLWIPSTVSDQEREVALAFIEFMLSPEELEAYMLAEGGIAPNLKTSNEFNKKRSEDALMYEYVNSVNADTRLVPNFEEVVPHSISNLEFGKLLPKLIDGSLSAEDFCNELTKKASETGM